jgi:hypothetical protein
MPVIRRTQPTSLSPKPTYAFGGQASRLAATGLKPSQVDKAHSAPAPVRGAGYNGGNRRSALAYQASKLAAATNTVRHHTGRSPGLETPIGATSFGGGLGGGGAGGGHGGGPSGGGGKH